MPNMPSLPKVSLPKVRLPSIPIPDRFKGAVAVLVVLGVFFGPHAWIMASAVTDTKPFGELPIGGIPDLSSFTDGYGQRDDAEPVEDDAINETDESPSEDATDG